MTMASWSDPESPTTWNSTGRTPRANAWSSRSQRSEPGQGPQVLRGELPRPAPCLVPHIRQRQAPAQQLLRLQGREGRV